MKSGFGANPVVDGFFDGRLRSDDEYQCIGIARMGDREGKRGYGWGREVTGIGKLRVYWGGNGK